MENRNRLFSNGRPTTITRDTINYWGPDKTAIRLLIIIIITVIQ